MRCVVARVVSILSLAVVTGCVAEVSNYCVDNPGECPECLVDDDCRFSGNPCTDTVFCAHRETSIAVIEIGCSEASERIWPDDDECRCIGGVCRVED